MGVNLTLNIHVECAKGFPHARGGEPFDFLGYIQPSSVFPTNVGVNRSGEALVDIYADVFPTHVGVNLRL